MVSRGPVPKPTRLRIIEGNPSKRPINDREPRPTLKAPACPRWLMPEAKAEWRRVMPELERLGLLTQLDRAAFAGYCQSWARYVEAEAKVEQYGEILKAAGSDYIQQSPYVIIANKHLQMARAFCQEFGLTPSSRSRMQVPEVGDDGEEDLD